MAIDRSKFKNLGTTLEASKQVDAALQEQLGTTDNSRVGYLDISKDGSLNYFRIYPPHPEEDGGGITYYEPKVVCRLPILTPVRDDQGRMIMEGDKPKLEVKFRNVFNAKIHGNAEVDLVESFIETALKISIERWPNFKVNEDQKKERTKYLLPIYGSFNQANPKLSIQGCNYQSAWVIYADKIEGTTAKFGRLELKKTIKDRLNQIAAIEAAGQPLGTDPFTDIDEGRAIIVRYDSTATVASNYYTVEIDSSTTPETIGGRPVRVQKTYPLTDQQIEAWSQQEPLAKMFKNVFTFKDFKMQVEGLKRIDETTSMGIFQREEFLEVLEVLTSIYADEERAAKESEIDQMQDEIHHADDTQAEGLTSQLEGQSSDEEYEDEDDETAEGVDKYSLMSRDELKAEIKERKLGIVVRPNLKDDKLRDLLREADLNKAEYVDDDIQAEEFYDSPNNAPIQTEEKSEKPLSAKERIALMRQNAKK